MNGRRWLWLGCLGLGAVAAVAAIVGGVVSLTALRQIRSERAERDSVEHRLPPQRSARRAPEADGDRSTAPSGRGRVVLAVSVAQLTVLPAAAGEFVRLETRYDPNRYALDERFERAADGSWTYRIRFEPSGSSMLALLRVKLGGPLPKLRLSLPRGVPLVLNGEVRSGVGAVELGGLIVESAELRAEQGALSLSFAEPLAEPMEWLSLVGDKGSVEITGLGNASPDRTSVRQHLGEIDLDLRGRWVRDGEIRVGAALAGGTIWLPEGVTILGLEDRLEPVRERSELPRPVLTFSLERRGGSLAVVE
ncbi:MAG TPA: hypothetical protein VD788_10815 [Candidatus Polarisedimenticolaceae bacterium]|nr:hypothetical protein [Candidatus Polarisedimenticolaceae bacterium]